MHDRDGRPLDGGSDYRIHFVADALPPVAAFLSITMYDAEGFHAANEVDRFAIGDRDPLVYNADGSLDIWISHANPGPDRVANWLPAPLGALGVTIRLYAPRASVLGGDWASPPVERMLSFLCGTFGEAPASIRDALTRPQYGTCSSVQQDLAPPDGRRGSETKAIDPLAWYATGQCPARVFQPRRDW